MFKKFVIKWVKRRVIRRVPRNPVMALDHSSLERKRLSDLARNIVQSRLAYYNQFYQLPYKRIAIKNQKTRWGSCSSKGNLNFNYRIALIAPELQDYLIVHELCHLKEFNHKERFWELVSLKIPNYKILHKQLN